MEKNKDIFVFDPAGAPGRVAPWLARACAFAGAIVCSGLAGPGTGSPPPAGAGAKSAATPRKGVNNAE